jgi:hypothetical protein
VILAAETVQDRVGSLQARLQPRLSFSARSPRVGASIFGPVLGDVFQRAPQMRPAIMPR